MSLSSLYLDAFQTCAQIGNFTRAAEKLHITQSALSQRIKNLEDELGTSLFIRDRAGIKLTEHGSELLRYCEAKVSLESEVVERLRSANSEGLVGTIRIGAFSSVARSIILPALASLLSGSQRLKLQLISAELEELPALLKNGTIDYMVLDQNLVREELANEPLGEEINVLVQKKGYIGADIYLDHNEQDQTTFKYLRLRSPEKISKIDRLYLDDVYGIIDGVKLGMGRAVLPLHLVKREKDLSVLDRERSLKIPVVLHYYKRSFYSRLHEQVVYTLKTRATELLSK